MKNNPINKALIVALVAGSTLALSGADAAGAFIVSSGGGIPIPDQNPFFPDKVPEPGIWDETDPEPDEDNPRGHIDIPEIDREPPGPPTNPVLLPPPPGIDENPDIIVGDIDGDFDIDLGRKDFPLTIDPLDGSTTFVPQSGSSVPAPGTIGLFGLGVLAASRRRRA